MDVRLARPLGTAGYPGDLGDPEPDDMAEHNCFALWSGEGIEAPLPRRGVRGIEVVPARVRCLDQSRAPRTVPEVVAPDVQGDRPHPGLQSKLSYPLRRIPGQGAIGADEGFLTQVFCLVPVADHPTEAPIETWRHVLDQPGESRVEIAGQVAD